MNAQSTAQYVVDRTSKDTKVHHHRKFFEINEQQIVATENIVERLSRQSGSTLVTINGKNNTQNALLKTISGLIYRPK